MAQSVFSGGTPLLCFRVLLGLWEQARRWSCVRRGPRRCSSCGGTGGRRTDVGDVRRGRGRPPSCGLGPGSELTLFVFVFPSGVQTLQFTNPEVGHFCGGKAMRCWYEKREPKWKLKPFLGDQSKPFVGPVFLETKVVVMACFEPCVVRAQRTGVELCGLAAHGQSRAQGLAGAAAPGEKTCPTEIIPPPPPPPRPREGHEFGELPCRPSVSCTKKVPCVEHIRGFSTKCTPPVKCPVLFEGTLQRSQRETLGRRINGVCSLFCVV